MLIEASETEVMPPEWLVDGMIPRVGAGFVYGKSYWGKSLLVNGELALAVANGADFFGRATIQGSVILALGEGQYDAPVRKQARISRERQDREAIARDMGDDGWKWLAEQPAYSDAKLKFWPDPFTIPITRIGSDGEGEITRSLQRFINAARRVKDLELVVIDAMSDFTGGLSISNDTSANRFMLGINEMVRQLECCVLIVAHPDKRGNTMIGAGRLFNAADFVIKIEPDESSANKRKSATLLCEKNKYGPMFDPTGYTIEPCSWYEPVFDEFDDPTGEAILVRSATVRQHDGEPEIQASKPVELTEDMEPYDFVDLPTGRPTKQSYGMRGRGRPTGDRSRAIVELAGSRPDGITAQEVTDELGIPNARVFLARMTERGDLVRISTGRYGRNETPKNL